MSDVGIAVLFAMVAVVAPVVVLTREPVRQALVLSAYGVVLGVLMLVLDAPDVAMSQVAVGAAIVPLVVVLAIAACNREVARRDRDRESGS